MGDDVEQSEGTFTVSGQGPPYLEVTENVAGSQVWHSDGRPLAFHHLGFWVDDVHGASERLAAAGYPVQAGGLDASGRYRYTYHDVNGLRVEMADARARAAFERWATSGQADGVSADFELSSADRGRRRTNRDRRQPDVRVRPVRTGSVRAPAEGCPILRPD